MFAMKQIIPVILESFDNFEITMFSKSASGCRIIKLRLRLLWLKTEKNSS